MSFLAVACLYAVPGNGSVISLQFPFSIQGNTVSDFAIDPDGVPLFYIKKVPILTESGLFTYNITDSSATMIQILTIIAMELMALLKPTSPFNSWVKGGTAEPMGLNTRITSA